MPKEYKYQYNHYYALLPSAYREISTFNKWYHQRQADNLYRMRATEKSFWA